MTYKIYAADGYRFLYINFVDIFGIPSRQIYKLYNFFDKHYVKGISDIPTIM